MDYDTYAKVMKAMADPKRVKILDLLASGSMCACDVLEHFDFTQPTLSHHIKILVEAGLVSTDKQGTWHHYSIDEARATQVVSETIHLFSLKENQINHTFKGEKICE